MSCSTRSSKISPSTLGHYLTPDQSETINGPASPIEDRASSMAQLFAEAYSGWRQSSGVVVTNSLDVGPAAQSTHVDVQASSKKHLETTPNR